MSAWYNCFNCTAPACFFLVTPRKSAVFKPLKPSNGVTAKYYYFLTFIIKNSKKNVDRAQ